MRYVVSGRQELLETERPYEKISVARAFEILEPMRIVGLDTETEGFDVYTKRLISVQLGNFDHQVLIDCTTVDILLFKEYLESDRLFILTNAKFDLKFFYHKRIVIRNVYDVYLAEKILYLGCLPGQPGLGLKDLAHRYLGIELDKTVRGKIHYEGLSDEVIIYACDDVKYLEQIKDLQEQKLAEQDLLIAVDVENKFVRVLAYVEYCGVRLDVEKWKAKMIKDERRLKEAETLLNNWLIKYCEDNPEVQASTVNIIHIPLWTQDEGTNYNVDAERAKVRKKKGARRVPVKDVVTETWKTEAWAVPNKNPWILRQVQGDLFSNEQASAVCLVNWNSSTQVIPVLEHLGFDLLARDKETGEMKKSVEAKVIEPQKYKSPFAPIYLEYKAAQKVVSTYGQNFLDQINPKSHRIHTQFTQLMDTGRLSCGGKNKQTKEEYLNLQNIPRDPETRSCFISSEGHDWISADYQGQESVIITNMSKDKAMIEFFKKGEGDLHSLAAKMAYPEHLKGIELKDVEKDGHYWRQEAKGVE